MPEYSAPIQPDQFQQFLLRWLIPPLDILVNHFRPGNWGWVEIHTNNQFIFFICNNVNSLTNFPGLKYLI